MTNLQTRRLVESAVMIAIGTVLSMFEFKGPWALGGGITFCSMLPLVLVSWRYGCRWGLFTAFVHSLLQMLLGISNVQYATNVWTAILIILFDYVFAYSVIGLAAMFKNRLKNQQAALVLGITVTFLVRLACHYISGVAVWEVLWPNELGWAFFQSRWRYAFRHSDREILLAQASRRNIRWRPLQRRSHI